MMYDELIARIRYHIRKADFMGLKEYESTRLLNETADAIEELRKLFQSAEKDNAKLTAWYVEKCNKHKWIPVTERLPENTGKYLVCGQWRGKPAEIWICDLIAFGKIKGWSNNVRNPVVTHWMPLPELPKEE